MKNWNYRSKKFIQNMGENGVKKAASNIAEYLNLNSPAAFTSHSILRSSCSIAANNGATIPEMQVFYDGKTQV